MFNFLLWYLLFLPKQQLASGTRDISFAHMSRQVSGQPQSNVAVEARAVWVPPKWDSAAPTKSKFKHKSRSEATEIDSSVRKRMSLNVTLSNVSAPCPRGIKENLWRVSVYHTSVVSKIPMSEDKLYLRLLLIRCQPFVSIAALRILCVRESVRVHHRRLKRHVVNRDATYVSSPIRSICPGNVFF